MRWLYLLRNSARRVPRRRHGTGQDHSGALAAAGAQAASARTANRTEPAGRARFAARQLGGEIERFAPGLKTLIAHPSAMPAAELKALSRSGWRMSIW